MFSQICNCILEICQSMFSSIWETSWPSYWGARNQVRTVPSTRYLRHLASMAKSSWIEKFWKHFENRVGLGDMLQIYKSILTNTTIEAYVEQICQSMFLKLCNCILKTCQSMFSRILEASRPSYLGARKWVRTVRSTRYLWHLASMAESIWIDMFWKHFGNRIGLGNMLNIWQFMLTNATLELKYTLNRCANLCFLKYAIVYWKYANPCFQAFGKPPGRVIGGPGNELGRYLAPGTCGILHPWLNPYGLICFETILKIESVFEICWKYVNRCWTIQYLKHTLNKYANHCFQNYAIAYWKYANPCFQAFGRPPGRVIGGPGNELELFFSQPQANT